MSPEAWATVRHPGLGLSLDLPEGLEVVVQDARAAAVVASEPSAGDGWMPVSLVVTVEDPGLVPDWEDRSRDALLETLDHPLLIDQGPRPLADGVPAHHLVTHYLHPTAGAVVLDQLLVRHLDRGVVVSCTVGALWHDDRADAFHRAQTSLRLPERWDV